MGVGKSRKFATSFAILLTLVFSLMAGVVAHAQVTGATVSGTVTDPSGGVVANATVSAANSATAVTRDVTSDSSGLYSIPNLVPGPYEFRVSAAGFSTSVQSGLTLAVGQQLAAEFRAEGRQYVDHRASDRGGAADRTDLVGGHRAGRIGNRARVAPERARLDVAGRSFNPA